jgi:hypothetical protein
MESTTITIDGIDYGVEFRTIGGKFKGDWMQPADPIEVEIIAVWFNDYEITAICDIDKVETAVRESL